MTRTPFGQGYLGRCVPCGDLRGLGQTDEPLRFDIGRDLTAGAVAFGAPLAYHHLAPKKWKRFGPVGNVVAVVALYIATAWTYTRVKRSMATP